MKNCMNGKIAWKNAELARLFTPTATLSHSPQHQAHQVLLALPVNDGDLSECLKLCVYVSTVISLILLVTR